MKLQDVIHHYLKAECMLGKTVCKIVGMNWGEMTHGWERPLLVYLEMPDYDKTGLYYGWEDVDKIKLILRRIESLTKDEAIRLVGILFIDPGIDKIDRDEIDVELVKGDGGNDVDEDIDLVMNVDCRCFDGQIAIRKCGTIMLFDEEGELQRLQNVPEAFTYLISLGIDLFNLIDQKLAIEKTSI